MSAGGKPAALLVAALLGGCADLLPKGSIEASSSFESFEAAQTSTRSTRSGRCNPAARRPPATS
jgi:hypothetical protein